MRRGLHIPACTLWLLLAVASVRPGANGGQYWVSPTGNDGNAGTFGAPFATIAKAMSLSSTVFRPGDTVFVRGGTYVTSAAITISKKGADTARYHLLAFPGERPLLDCSGMTVGGSNRGIYLSGHYWYIRGIDVKGAGDNGMYVTGSHNTIEFCAFFENRDTGLQLSGGASFNAVINCDSYANADPGQGNADGFAPKLDVGTGNYFYGCRSWQNSDDGWDGYLRPANDVTTTLENCWCFQNGYLNDGSPSVGNGNGFKLGGSDARDLMHNFILKKCISFDNRVKGFDQNNNRGSMTLLNCSGYRDWKNYSIGDTLAPGKTLTVKNSLSLGPYGTLRSNSIQQTNSWMPPFGTVTVSDFVSVDTTGVRGPRKPDGSLPDLPFLHLAAGSQLIDAGTDIGLAYAGAAPDLGAFETGMITAVRQGAPSIAVDAGLLRNYPNPFNASSDFGYRLLEAADVTLQVFDLLGRETAVLVNERKAPGSYVVRWDASGLPSGVYVAVLHAGGDTRVRRVLLVR
jgi:hypothetical protein